MTVLRKFVTKHLKLFNFIFNLPNRTPESKNFRAVDSKFAIDGGLVNSNISYLKENYASVLYLATDSETDLGFVYIV